MTAAAALKHRARMAGECAQCREESFRWDADEGAVACQNKYCGAFAPVGDYTFEIRPVACPFLPELTIENKDGHRNCYAEPAPRNGKGRDLVYQIWPRGNYGVGVHSMPWHTLLVCRPTWEDAEKYARAEWREWLESQGWGAAK